MAGAPSKPPAPTATAVVRFFTFPPGRVEEIRGLAQARQLGFVDELVIRLQPGETASAVRDSKSRHGHVHRLRRLSRGSEGPLEQVLTVIDAVIDGVPARADGRTGALEAVS